MKKDELPLSEYISGTITEIIRGINEANHKLNPPNVGTVGGHNKTASIGTPDGGFQPFIEFDLAVTIERTSSRKNEASGEASFSFNVIDLIKAKVSAKHENEKKSLESEANRIKFQVPLNYK